MIEFRERAKRDRRRRRAKGSALSADRGEIHRLLLEYEISQDAITRGSVETVNPKIPGAQKLANLAVGWRRYCQ